MLLVLAPELESGGEMVFLILLDPRNMRSVAAEVVVRHLVKLMDLATFMVKLIQIGATSFDSARCVARD